MTAHLLAVARTPVGQLDGRLATCHPVELLATVLASLEGLVGTDGAAAAGLLVGCQSPAGAQGANVARAAALVAGWTGVPAATVEDGPTSGDHAFHAAVDRLESGRADVIVVGGVDVASVVPAGAVALGERFGKPWGPAFARRFEGEGDVAPVSEVARRCEESRGVPAERQLEWAATSRRRAAATGPDPSVVAVTVGPRDVVDADEPVPEPEPGADLLDPEREAVCPPVLAPPADGAAAAVLVSDAWLDGEGRTPAARVEGLASVAGHPFAGAPPLAQALAAAQGDGADSLELDDRCAAFCLAALDEIRADPDRVNRRGGMLGRGDTGGASFLHRLAWALADAGPGERLAVVSGGSLGTALATVLTREG